MERSTSSGACDQLAHVGIGDFLIVIGTWGTPGGDIDGDGDTGISDFLAVLGLWGPCPNQ